MNDVFPNFIHIHFVFSSIKKISCLMTASLIKIPTPVVRIKRVIACSLSNQITANMFEFHEVFLKIKKNSRVFGFLENILVNVDL